MTGPELVSWFSPGYKASSGPERRIKVGSNSEIHNNHVVLTGPTRDLGPEQACNQDLNQETSSGPVTSLFRTRTKGHCLSCGALGIHHCKERILSSRPILLRNDRDYKVPTFQ